MINTTTTPLTADLTDLASASVRELVTLLTQLEDRLRSTPFLVSRDDLVVVNPAIAPLLSRQRSIVAQLRSRRTSWSGSETARAGGHPGRAASASWPRPPWS